MPFAASIERQAWTTTLIAISTLVAVGGMAITWRFPRPRPLPNRMATIADDEVQIDNDVVYQTYDWWGDFQPLALANGARVPFFLRSLQKHFDQHDSLKGVRILDVGCGGGLVTEAIVESSGASVVGVDLSKESIDKAQKHSRYDKDRLSYVVGSAYELPFPNGSFDAIVCSDVFEHLHDVPTALREMERVLKPGGMLVYDTVNRTTFSWYVAIVLAQELIRYVPDDVHDWRLFVRPEEMHKATHDAGLRHAPLKSITGMRPTLAYPWTILGRLWNGYGRLSFFDRWTMTSMAQASYLSTCTKP